MNIGELAEQASQVNLEKEGDLNNARDRINRPEDELLEKGTHPEEIKNAQEIRKQLNAAKNNKEHSLTDNVVRPTKELVNAQSTANKELEQDLFEIRNENGSCVDAKRQAKNKKQDKIADLEDKLRVETGATEAAQKRAKDPQHKCSETATIFLAVLPATLCVAGRTSQKRAVANKVPDHGLNGSEEIEECLKAKADGMAQRRRLSLSTNHALAQELLGLPPKKCQPQRFGEDLKMVAAA
ncbi:hypothetical protein E8E12_010438 [Didymella heteroderae]|uniref:Uncharacterized protein n=1 Tax=Didymella heteroderae TaxID=1769908 RepID=A0A9P4WX18_9PLEO|nr:hypothetical protein E8E12_010438 [Didymella heteroderae]